MFSDLVQRSVDRPLSMLRACMSGVILAAMLVSGSVWAGWQDPLQSPAMPTERAHKNLLLDVVRADNRLVAVGTHGHIIVSDDHGLSWQQARVPVTATLTAVHFPSGQYGWAVGHDGVILHSNDGGLNWTKQFDGYVANDAIVAAAQKRLQLAEARLEQARLDDDPLAIEDAEMRLENAIFGLDDAQYDASTGSTKPFLDVWFYDARRGFALGAYGMIFHTQDGGQTWEDASARLPNPDRLHLNAITVVGAQSLVIVGEMGLFVRSDDLGENWHQQMSPYDGSLFGLVSHDDHQLLFGLRGHVFRSDDGGIQWQELQTGSEQSLFGGFVGRKNTLLVGNGGSVVFFDAELGKPRSLILEGRQPYAAVVEARNGDYVLVGEAGVKRLNAQGDLLDQHISMAAGDF